MSSLTHGNVLSYICVRLGSWFFFGNKREILCHCLLGVYKRFIFQTSLYSGGPLFKYKSGFTFILEIIFWPLQYIYIFLLFDPPLNPEIIHTSTRLRMIPTYSFHNLKGMVEVQGCRNSR